VRSADRIAGAALLALAVAFGAGALKQHAYWGENGPGPAFLPFWLGLVMALLATMLLVGALRSQDPGGDWLPRGESLRRLAIVLGVTLAFAASLNVLGMTLATVLFLIVLLRWPDRLPWLSTVLIALAVAALLHVVFARWLRVPLPTGPFGF
jgi:putative tricarboxylic transport membrane protein